MHSYKQLLVDEKLQSSLPNSTNKKRRLNNFDSIFLIRAKEKVDSVIGSNKNIYIKYAKIRASKSANISNETI